MACHGCPQNCRNSSQGQQGNLLKIFSKKGQSPLPETTPLPQVALVGMPNVGKSVLFNALTGTYVTVSNYPGTTVEVVRGTDLDMRSPCYGSRYARDVLTAAHY